MRAPAQIALRSLAMIMMVKAIMIPVIYIDFKINQDYIARVLCINRDKPELNCNGNCVLMQKLKTAQETEQSQENQTNKKQSFETFCESLLCFDTRTFPDKPQAFKNYPQLFISNYSVDIFHPPKYLS